MRDFDRRSMLKVVAGLSLTPYSLLGDEKDGTVHLVEAGTDRTGQPHKAARANRLSLRGVPPWSLPPDSSTFIFVSNPLVLGEHGH